MSPEPLHTPFDGCGFSLPHYRDVLVRARLMGYAIRPMRDWAAGLATEPRSILLRHDIDVSLESIAPIDAIENELGIHATYYVRTRARFYDVGGDTGATAMAALRAHGHEVGLHYEPDPDGQSEVAWDDASKVALAADKARLIGVAGEPMEGAAAHRPAKAGALTPEQVRSVGFAYEATGPTLEAASPRWKYLADSRGQWREGCICGWLGNVDRLIMVVHPIWWTGGQADRANILERLGRGD